ncbi:hypothetical protein D3C78_716850 [compost metagenome]
MAHYNDIMTFTNEITQCVRHYPCSYTGTLLDCIGLSSIEGLPAAKLDRGLIAAASKCNIKTRMRPLAELDDVVCPGSKANTESNRDFVVARNLSDLIQHDEARMLQLSKRHLIRHQQKPVIGHSLHIDLELLRPFRNLRRHLGQHRAALVIIQSLRYFFQIVDHNNAKHELFVIIFAAQLPQLGNVIHIQNAFLLLEYEPVDMRADRRLDRPFPFLHLLQHRKQLYQRYADGGFLLQYLRHIRIMPFNYTFFIIQNNPKWQLADYIVPRLLHTGGQRA